MVPLLRLVRRRGRQERRDRLGRRRLSWEPLVLEEEEEDSVVRPFFLSSLAVSPSLTLFPPQVFPPVPVTLVCPVRRVVVVEGGVGEEEGDAVVVVESSSFVFRFLLFSVVRLRKRTSCVVRSLTVGRKGREMRKQLNCSLPNFRFLLSSLTLTKVRGGEGTSVYCVDQFDYAGRTRRAPRLGDMYKRSISSPFDPFPPPSVPPSVNSLLPPAVRPLLRSTVSSILPSHPNYR